MTLGAELTTLATILALLVYVWMIMNVGRARARLGVIAPATTGNPEFERIFRVQQNTMEQLVLFLPSLWLFHALTGGIWAGILGLVWVAARILYALAYYRDAEKRGPGMLLTLSPSLALLLGALVLLILNHFGSLP